tara:strand:+ start:659 stop:1075 length:417 start_codon:yes stop_codon:yes gene_type:complete
MWVCKKCKEELEDSFDICWKCGYEKDSNIQSKKSDENEKNDPSLTFDEIARENKRMMTTFKHSSLQVYKGLAYFFMLINTVITFFILKELYKIAKALGGTISNSMVLATIFYFFTIFVLLCLIKIIDFLFDLDKQTNN